MKYTTILAALAMLLAFASCKKASNNEIPPIKFEAAIPGDSSSFSINGTVYTGDVVASTSVGNAPVNESYDPATNVVNWIGSPDSVQLHFAYTIANRQNLPNNLLTIAFIKKYAKADLPLPRNGAPYYPADPLALFTPGTRPFAFDFERENSHDGVTIGALSPTGGGSTYSQIFLGRPTTITATSQSNSTFQITALTKLPKGGYMLEAKFNANLFDKGDNLTTRIENGYIRISIF